ncbi:MAG: hypothetical protein WCX95_04800 [Candidatus Gracilibacteria bacterium]
MLGRLIDFIETLDSEPKSDASGEDLDLVAETDEVPSSRGVTRRQALGILGASFLALAGCGKRKDPTPKKTRPLPHREQTTPRQEAGEEMAEYVEVGGVKFVFVQRDLPPQIKEKIAEYLRNGYEKLLAYFGPEVVKMPNGLLFPIGVDPQLFEQKGIEAKVIWKNEERFSPISGEPEAIGAPDPDIFIIGNLDEGVIFHELFHLYIQKTDMNVSSTAFLEGHAHAIHRTFFEHDTAIYGQLDKIPEIRQLLAGGVDFNTRDASDGVSGLQETHLKNLALVNWQNRWLEYLKMNPNFLKDFYKEVTRQRKEGKKYFFKKDLIDIASKVDPKFMEWYNTNGSSLKNLGETGTKEVVQAFRIPSLNTVVLANFAVNQGSGSGVHKPGTVTPVKKGPMRFAKIVQPGNRILAGNGVEEQDAPCLSLRRADNAFVNDPDLSVMVGKELIPTKLVSPQ